MGAGETRPAVPPTRSPVRYMATISSRWTQPSSRGECHRATLHPVATYLGQQFICHLLLMPKQGTHTSAWQSSDRSSRSPGRRHDCGTMECGSCGLVLLGPPNLPAVVPIYPATLKNAFQARQSVHPLVHGGSSIDRPGHPGGDAAATITCTYPRTSLWRHCFTRASTNHCTYYTELLTQCSCS